MADDCFKSQSTDMTPSTEANRTALTEHQQAHCELQQTARRRANDSAGISSTGIPRRRHNREHQGNVRSH